MISGNSAGILLLVLGYSYRYELENNRLVAELLPRHIRVNGNGSMEIRASMGEHFFVEGFVNSVPVRFLIDTGASDIVLSPYDAGRTGFRPETLEYSRVYTTANGYGKGAPVTLGEIKIGTVTLDSAAASVNQTDMEDSLLGMNFLRRLKSFHFEGDTLILNP